MTETKTIDIDTMPAGREMDALVAEFMGWMIYPFDEHRGNHEWLDNLSNYPYLTDQHGYYLLWRKPKEDGERWSPSTFIAAAWEVVEKLFRTGWNVSVDTDLLGFCATVWNEDDGQYFNCANTAPLAICRAAWKARR